MTPKITVGKTTQYATISIHNAAHDHHDDRTAIADVAATSKVSKKCSLAVMGVIFATWLAYLTTRNSSKGSNDATPSNIHSSFEPISTTKLPMPYGVNLASWLSLEDYFFVGDDGAVQVATPNDATAAICLPPIHSHMHMTGPSWQSETDLFQNLMTQFSVKYAVRVFREFRTTYMNLDEELRQIAALGIRNVRVPVSWCTTDFDPSNDELLLADASGDGNATHEDELLLQRYACVDPYYAKEHEQVYWPAVPKALIVDLLKACAKHNIKATLDIHTYMGGTSLGTFSGVWPKQPLFWKYDDPQDTIRDVGRAQFRNWLQWIESLSESDPEAFAGVGGVTPMNEPAHLAGLFGPGSGKSDEKGFVPPLPEHLATKYMTKLNKHSTSNITVPDGAHLRVLLWQSDAVDLFRQTTLPQKGINVVVNVHESIFAPALVTGDANNLGATHPHATGIFAAWWEAITTAEERSQWAILDLHHYHSWESACSGSIDGNGSYACGDSDATDAVLERCTSWAQVYRSLLPDEGDADRSQLYSGEFSSSTFHSVLQSCTDAATIRKSYLAQIEAARKANVNLFYWSWKMPFGGAFRQAWSFKQLMYMLGVEGFAHPDESVAACQR
ncbi:hypothetical protein MPSEU_000327400 [Mayamaea pseudoterrestris]|nr:hypothetical protein MPSEU_000327400 [Mayamaea pseudoterrestris]